MNHLDKYILAERKRILNEKVERQSLYRRTFDKKKKQLNRFGQLIDAELNKLLGSGKDKGAIIKSPLFNDYKSTRFEDDKVEMGEALKEFSYISKTMKADIKKSILSNVDYLFEEMLEYFENFARPVGFKANWGATGAEIVNPEKQKEIAEEAMEDVLIFEFPGEFADYNPSLFLTSAGDKKDALSRGKSGAFGKTWRNIKRSFQKQPSYKVASQESRKVLAKLLTPYLADVFLSWINEKAPAPEEEPEVAAAPEAGTKIDKEAYDASKMFLAKVAAGEIEAPKEAIEANKEIVKKYEAQQNADVPAAAAPVSTSAGLPAMPEAKKPFYCPSKESYNKVFCENEDLWALEARNAQMWRATGKAQDKAFLTYLKAKKAAGGDKDKQIELIKKRIKSLEEKYLAAKKPSGEAAPSEKAKAKVKVSPGGGSTSSQNAMLAKTSHKNLAGLQNYLMGAGFYDKKLEDTITFKSGAADGRYGPETRSAIKNLQKELGVKADGVYGPNTDAAFRKKPEVQGANSVLAGAAEEKPASGDIASLKKAFNAAADEATRLATGVGASDPRYKAALKKMNLAQAALQTARAKSLEEIIRQETNALLKEKGMA